MLGRHLRADVAHRGQLLDARGHQPVERAEVLRQRGGRRLADLPDAERHQEAGEGGLLAALELGAQVLGRLLAHALEPDERRLVEVVEVGEVAHQAALDQLIDQLLAETLDVEGAARRRRSAAPA